MFALAKLAQATDIYKSELVKSGLPSVLQAHLNHLNSYSVQFHFLQILELVARNLKLSEHCLSATLRIINDVAGSTGTSTSAHSDQKSAKLLVKALQVAL